MDENAGVNESQEPTTGPMEIPIDVEKIGALIALCKQAGVADFEMKTAGNALKIAFAQPAAAPVQIQSAPAQPAAAPVYVEALAAAPQVAAPAKQEELPGTIVKSPMVGTFYRAPSPESSPYAEVGSKVSEETVLCIVEAMKIMNEIKAEVRGTVAEILVDNGHPVEYGQPMFRIVAG